LPAATRSSAGTEWGGRLVSGGALSARLDSLVTLLIQSSLHAGPAPLDRAMLPKMAKDEIEPSQSRSIFLGVLVNCAGMNVGAETAMG